MKAGWLALLLMSCAQYDAAPHSGHTSARSSAAHHALSLLCHRSLLLCRPPLAELSPPGSVLIAHNVTTELSREIEQGGGLYGPFRRELVATWRCFYPPAFERQALAGLLQQAGWRLSEVTTRARIAAAVCGRGGSSGSGSDGTDDAAAGEAGAGDAAGEAAGSSALAGQVDFDTRLDAGEDRFAVFFTAQR